MTLQELLESQKRESHAQQEIIYTQKEVIHVEDDEESDIEEHD
jgi:hypothetical protein